jgi:hypothetical protein
MTGDEATVIGRPLPADVKRNTHLLRVSDTSSQRWTFASSQETAAARDQGAGGDR